MQTKHYVLLIGIVISFLLSNMAIIIHFDITGMNVFWMFIWLFICSWIIGGLIFWIIKKLILDED